MCHSPRRRTHHAPGDPRWNDQRGWDIHHAEVTPFTSDSSTSSRVQWKEKVHRAQHVDLDRVAGQGTARSLNVDHLKERR